MRMSTFLIQGYVTDHELFTKIGAHVCEQIQVLEAEVLEKILQTLSSQLVPYLSDSTLWYGRFFKSPFCVETVCSIMNI